MPKKKPSEVIKEKARDMARKYKQEHNEWPFELTENAFYGEAIMQFLDDETLGDDTLKQ